MASANKEGDYFVGFIPIDSPENAYWEKKNDPIPGNSNDTLGINPSPPKNKSPAFNNYPVFMGKQDLGKGPTCRTDDRGQSIGKGPLREAKGPMAQDTGRRVERPWTVGSGASERNGPRMDINRPRVEGSRPLTEGKGPMPDENALKRTGNNRPLVEGNIPITQDRGNRDGNRPLAEGYRPMVEGNGEERLRPQEDKTKPQRQNQRKNSDQMIKDKQSNDIPNTNNPAIYNDKRKNNNNNTIFQDLPENRTLPQKQSRTLPSTLPRTLPSFVDRHIQRENRDEPDSVPLHRPKPIKPVPNKPILNKPQFKPAGTTSQPTVKPRLSLASKKGQGSERTDINRPGSFKRKEPERKSKTESAKDHKRECSCIFHGEQDENDHISEAPALQSGPEQKHFSQLARRLTASMESLVPAHTDNDFDGYDDYDPENQPGRTLKDRGQGGKGGGTYVKRRRSSLSDVTGILSTTSSVAIQQVPLVEWSSDQVLQWLDAVGLGELADRFKAYGVRGQDLAGISMQLLDDINISSTQHRHQLLTQLSQLQQHQQFHRADRSQQRIQSTVSNDSESTVNAASQGSVTSKMEQLENLEYQLLREIALLRDSVNERDEKIANLSAECESLHNQAQKSHDLEDELLRSQMASDNHKQKHEDTIAALQQQIAEVNRQMMDLDPSARMRHLQKELTETEAKLDAEKRRRLVPPLYSRLSMDQQQRQSELNIRSLTQRCEDLRNLIASANADSNAPPKLSLYDQFGGYGTEELCVAVCDLPLLSGSYGLMLARDARGHVVVKSVNEGSPLCHNDILLEVNSESIKGMDDGTLGQLLKDAKQKQQHLRLVVLRNQLKHSSRNPVVTNEEFEIFKQDLSLALVELEAAHEDKRKLQVEVERVRQSKEELRHDNEQLRKEVIDLKQKLFQIDDDWKQLKDALNRRQQQQRGGPGGTGSPGGDVDRQLLQLLDDIQAARKSARASFRVHGSTTTPKEGLDLLQKLATASDRNQVLDYDKIDDKTPIWRSLSDATKEEVLQALKDSVLEHRQQKVYLDLLLSLVIDHAPDLLETVDHILGLEADAISLRSHTEEHC